MRCPVVRPRRRRGRPGRRPGPVQLVRLALEGGDAVQRTEVVKSVRAVSQFPLSRLSHDLAAARSGHSGGRWGSRSGRPGAGLMPGCGSGGRRQCRYLGFCRLWAGSAGAVRPGRCYAAAGAPAGRRRVRVSGGGRGGVEHVVDGGPQVDGDHVAAVAQGAAEAGEQLGEDRFDDRPSLLVEGSVVGVPSLAAMACQPGWLLGVSPPGCADSRVTATCTGGHPGKRLGRQRGRLTARRPVIRPSTP